MSHDGHRGTATSNLGGHEHSGALGRSASTSSAGSLASSGLGSSPLGGAAPSLPLFGNGMGNNSSNPPTVVNGCGPTVTHSGGGGGHNGSNDRCVPSPPIISHFSDSIAAGVNQRGVAISRPSSHTPPVTNPTHSGTSSAPKCPLCCAPFNRPKVLHECFCVFCQTCLEKVQDHPDKITCPKCRKETSGLSHGVAGLLSDTGLIDFLLNRQCNSPPSSSSPPTSTSMGGNSSSSSGLVGGIRLLDSFQHSSNSSSHHSSLPSHQTSSSSSNSSGNYMQQCSIVSCTNSAVARCLTCHTNLCSACVNTHLFNDRFDNSHLVCSIGEYLSKQQQLSGESPSSVPAPGSTGTSPSSEMRVFCELNNMLQKSRGRASEIRTQQKMMESGVLVLADSYNKAKMDIVESFQCYFSLLEDRKQELMRDLDSAYNNKRMLINGHISKNQENHERFVQVSDFTERLFRHSSHSDVHQLRAVLEQRFHSVLSSFEAASPPVDAFREVAFVPNYQAFQSATRNAVGCLKRTDGGPSSSSCNTSDSHHPGGQNQQHPLQQRYHNGGGGPSTPGMPGSAGAIGKQPPISRPTPKSNQHENNNTSSLNGGLVLSSLMNSDGHHGSHSGHHHSGSSGSSGSAAAAAAAALVQGIATTSGGSNMSNSHDSLSHMNGSNGRQHQHPHSSSSSGGGGLHSLANGIGGLHLPPPTQPPPPSSASSNGVDNNGLNGLDRLLQGRFASNNSPAGFSSASSNSSQTIGGFDSLFSKRGGGGSTGGAHHGGSNPLSSLINGGSGSGQGNCDNNSSIYDKWSNGNNSSSGGLFSDADNLAAAVATYKAINNGSNGGQVDTNHLLDALPGMLQQQHQMHPHHQQQQPPQVAAAMAGTGMFTTPKSQIKRQKMIYHCKFGEFGVLEGQFTEPSGVAVNAQNDIIVADTNNHRVQIFDKDGRFKFQFGECGKRDGQLLYPNRVAAVRSSGDIIVTERSPTHQVQIYNQYGQFVRKFGANILQHPRGVCVDSKGRIIVVECKVMRVIIFDQMGNVLNKFGCSKHLEFPNGVVVNDRQEIFISDNRAHCVKVFNYEGQYLRQIGGEGLTNYPIGVGINAAGEVTIADNHNNFNLSVFSQDGKLLSALESKVKHAQCFDVALMDDGSVVLASKDYRLYIYRYVQLPPIGM